MYRLVKRDIRLHVYPLTSDARQPLLHLHSEGDHDRIFDHATMWAYSGDCVRLFTDILSAGRDIENRACAIVEEMFRLGDDLMCVNHGNNNVTMAPIWSPNASILLCEPSRRRNLYVYTAVMNSHTYISAWGTVSQYRESRDICTIVDFRTSGDELTGTNISTGNGCLYGFYQSGTNCTNISLLDPRQNAAPQIVYFGGGDTVEIASIRDVPNGTMTLVDSHVVTLFDHRACAMIGTDIILGYYEYMFCHN